MNHDKFEKNFQICRYPRGNELEASGKAVLACLSNTNVISSSSEVLYETDAVYAAKCPDDFMDIPPATIEKIYLFLKMPIDIINYCLIISIIEFIKKFPIVIFVIKPFVDN